MTESQMQQITDMRKDGLGYTTIASRMGITKDRVRSFCRTRGLTGARTSSYVPENAGDNYCINCGNRLGHTAGKRKRKFCSDDCRLTWWNNHPDQVKRKAYYSFTCHYCKAQFSAYGNANRTYCSHECYIHDRFHRGSGK